MIATRIGAPSSSAPPRLRSDDFPNRDHRLAGRMVNRSVTGFELPVRESNSTFTVGSPSTPLTAKASATHHKRGTVFSFRLDQVATVKIAIQKKVRGRRVGRSCRADSRSLRHKPRCIRTITVARLTRSAHAGLDKVAFSGRIRGKAIPPGRYQVTFTAIDAAGASPPKTLSFTIVKRSI